MLIAKERVGVDESPELTCNIDKGAVPSLLSTNQGDTPRVYEGTPRVHFTLSVVGIIQWAGVPD